VKQSAQTEEKNMNVSPKTKTNPGGDSTIFEIPGSIQATPRSRRLGMVPVTADELSKVEGGRGAVVMDDNYIAGRSALGPIIKHGR
jgi:hypothetical protein